MEQIKVLAFDTGGTVLDWHAGLTAVIAAWGAAHDIERDWHALANEHRRRSLRRMTSTIDPGFNIDDVHRDIVGECSTRTSSAVLRRSGEQSPRAGTSLVTIDCVRAGLHGHRNRPRSHDSPRSALSCPAVLICLTARAPPPAEQTPFLFSICQDSDGRAPKADLARRPHFSLRHWTQIPAPRCRVFAWLSR